VGDDARVVQRADGGHCGDSESPSWSSGLLDPLVDRLTYGSGRDGAPPCRHGLGGGWRAAQSGELTEVVQSAVLGCVMPVWAWQW
jgi:hypothetical protein